MTKLPGFEQGDCSVQDGAASGRRPARSPAGRVGAGRLRRPRRQNRTLLERQPALAGVVAVDADDNRLKRVQENLDRIGLRAPSDPR